MAGQKDLFLEQALYCIDASSIILLRQSYPKDVFPTVHEQITPVFRSGKILILNSVLDELKEKEPDLFIYSTQSIPKERQEKYENYILTTQKIIQTYYDGKGKSHNIKADPHIISCAKSEKLTVITEEIGSDPTKIPYICSHEGVKCINFIELLRQERIKS
jgi:hypothetical protein